MDAVASPVVDLPGDLASMVDTQIENLFSENDLQRKAARRWLLENGNTEIMHKISEKALQKNGGIPTKVKSDVHTLLSRWISRNIKAIARIGNERSARIRTAMITTMVCRR